MKGREHFLARPFPRRHRRLGCLGAEDYYRFEQPTAGRLEKMPVEVDFRCIRLD